MTNEQYYKEEIIDAIIEMYGYNVTKTELIECRPNNCNVCVFNCSENDKKHCLPPSRKREFFNSIYDSVLLQKEKKKVASILGFDRKAECPCICYSIPCRDCDFESKFCSSIEIEKWLYNEKEE